LRSPTTPVAAAQVPQARGAKRTKAVVEYELLSKHPYTYTEEDIGFQVYAVLHDIPKDRAKVGVDHPVGGRREAAAESALQTGLAPSAARAAVGASPTAADITEHSAVGSWCSYWPRLAPRPCAPQI
jgi:Family of unknown function (DUF6157)